MRTMTDQQWRAFVAHGTRTGKLSTVRADGSPHVAPVWFLLDGDDLVFTTGLTSVKGRNLTRDARFSLCVDDDRPPYAFVILHGTADISEKPDDVRHWAGRLAARYMGPERADEYAARNGAPGEGLVRAHIDKVIALDAVAD
jgi:PPOX class probable F420-dependent enzyme